MPISNRSSDWVALTGVRVSKEVAEQIDEQAKLEDRTRVGQVRYLLGLGLRTAARCRRLRKLYSERQGNA
jgi:hypothetical protein